MRTKDLQNAIEVAKKITASSGTIQPVLKNVYLKFKERSALIIATDLETTYALELDRPEGGMEFETTVDASQLAKTLKNTKAERVFFEYDDRLIIQADKTRYKLNTITAAEYPRFVFELLTSEFLHVTNISSEGFKKAATTAAKYESNNMLSGVNYNPLTGRFASTDGNALTVLDAEKSEFKGDVTIASSVCNYMTPSANYIINASKEHLIIQMINPETREQFFVKRYEGLFPKYEQLIPWDAPKSCLITSKDLNNVIKEVEITINPKTSIIKMRLDNSSMHIKSDTPDVGETITEANIKDAHFEYYKFSEIAFNEKYLKNFSKLDDTMTLHFGNSHLSAMVIKYPKNEKLIGLLMPVQIRE